MTESWSHEQDEKLKRCMSECRDKSWSDLVKTAFPDGSRSVEQCIERWKIFNRPMQIKGPWTPDEDRQLMALVVELSTNKWGEISKRLSTRSGKQCRERWHNHLDPSINKRPFTAEEDELIVRMWNEKGSKWAEISRHLQGRPDNAIKNHFNTALNRAKGLRSRRTSISSTATTSTSRSSDSPGPPSTPGRRRLHGPLMGDLSAPTSPRFAPYGRPRSGTDVSLLPSPGFSSAPPTAVADFTQNTSTMLTRSQSHVDIPSRRRSVRTSLQMTPARSLDAPLHLSFSEVNLQRGGFYPSGPISAPNMHSFASPSTAKTPDPFDTWSTPPATPDALASASRDYYFSGGASRPIHMTRSQMSSVAPPSSSSLQAALDDLILSPGSASSTRTDSMMTRVGSSNKALSSSPSPSLVRSVSVTYLETPLSRSGSVSALAMYDQGLTGHGHSPPSPEMYRSSLPSPGLMTDYGSSSSGHSDFSAVLPMTPPRSTPSSCSASSNSLSSYPFDHGDYSGMPHRAPTVAPFPAPASRQSAPAHHVTAHHHSYALRSSTRDTPSPAKSDLTA